MLLESTSLHYYPQASHHAVTLLMNHCDDIWCSIKCLLLPATSSKEMVTAVGNKLYFLKWFTNVSEHLLLSLSLCDVEFNGDRIVNFLCFAVVYSIQFRAHILVDMNTTLHF